MITGRIASWAILAASLAAVPAAAQNWPSNSPGPGKFPDAAPPASAPAPAGPGQFPPANAPQSLPAQPGAVPPPSQWGNNKPQHPAWGGGGSAAAAQHPAWSGGGAPIARPGAAPSSGGQLPCADEAMPLRDDTQKKGMALKVIIDTKKDDRKALCNAFRTVSAAEGKYVKFLQDNATRCSIPAEALKVMKDNHSKTATLTNRVCNAAAGPGAGAPPPPPSLSDALGTSRIPDSSNVKTGKGGTFDTLGGSAIGR